MISFPLVRRSVFENTLAENIRLRTENARLKPTERSHLPANSKPRNACKPSLPNAMLPIYNAAVKDPTTGRFVKL